MDLGYARTSTIEQKAGVEAQIRDLRAVGCKRIFSEQVSSVAERAELERAIEYAREGDTLFVCKPDRLARSTVDLLNIVARLERKAVGLVILSMGGQQLDTRTPTGKLMLTVLGAMAEFERGVMLERQREGIAKAAAEGKYKGRAPTALRKADEVRQLRAEGVGAAEIARRTGMCRASVYNVLKAECARPG